MTIVRNLEYHLKKWPELIGREELRENPENGVVQGHCKYSKCINSKDMDGWYDLLPGQAAMRAWGFRQDWDTYCFYCCDECRQSCPAYGKTASRILKEQREAINGLIKEEWEGVICTSHERNVWKLECERRNMSESLSDYPICEICGYRSAHVHHEKPVKTHPHLALDPCIGICLCIPCHYLFGHPKGTSCSTGNLAKKDCKVIKNRIETKEIASPSDTFYDEVSLNS